jgi:hypothetical protein
VVIFIAPPPAQQRRRTVRLRRPSTRCSVYRDEDTSPCRRCQGPATPTQTRDALSSPRPKTIWRCFQCNHATKKPNHAVHITSSLRPSEDEPAVVGGIIKHDLSAQPLGLAVGVPAPQGEPRRSPAPTRPSRRTGRSPNAAARARRPGRAASVMVPQHAVQPNVIRRPCLAFAVCHLSPSRIASLCHRSRAASAKSGCSIGPNHSAGERAPFPSANGARHARQNPPDRPQRT